ncbi:PEP-CTERM sorting domain-containing protein [Phragmitibacter flavus]|uniref:PEP-CTERM sorting domain-containing protein n=1 Tax=Phragmitibacter flavus TaxID=2576071 RepID=UPI001980F085|nr:PEP-CTERM sorting domain-containing protein [Phragmitibacter flavus]
MESDAQSQTIAQDDFSSNTLSGGSGWSNSWSHGTVVNGSLLFNGSGSQTTTRNFNGLSNVFTPRPGQNANGAFAGTYSIQFDIGFEINTAITGNFGFRMYQGQSNQGTSLLGVWKSDINNGSLTFGTSNNNNIIVPQSLLNDPMNGNQAFDVWNIGAAANSISRGIEYEFTYSIDVLHGQNPNQYRGDTYNVQVVRYDSGIATHTYISADLGWPTTGDLNIGNNLDNITFQNTNNKTNVFIDDLTVTSPVPEPSSSLLVLLSLTGFALIRRRRSPR